jgi:hypothetical protein
MAEIAIGTRHQEENRPFRKGGEQLVVSTGRAEALLTSTIDFGTLRSEIDTRVGTRRAAELSDFAALQNVANGP